MGLERSILFQLNNGPNIFIFDSDHLSYLYAAFAARTGLIKIPFLFIHLDAHIDCAQVERRPPRAKQNRINMKDHLNYFLKYVWESNFVTAMAKGGLISEVRLVTFERSVDAMLMGIAIKQMNLHPTPWSNFYPTEPFPDDFFSFKGSKFLGVDLDNFGIATVLKGESPLYHARAFMEDMRRVGYTAKTFDVVGIATSPGYDEGYGSSEDKLEVAKYLSRELSKS